jgi:hypothetical protein
METDFEGLNNSEINQRRLRKNTVRNPKSDRPRMELIQPENIKNT